MAFTDVEVQEAQAAIEAGAKSEDLFRLGLIYSTDLEDRGPDFAEIKMEMSHDDLTLAQRAARGWLAENRELLAA